MKQKYFLGIIFFVILAIYFIFFSNKDNSIEKVRKTKEVNVIKVKQKEFPLTIKIPAVVSSQDNIILSAMTSGKITKINFKNGQFVKKGTVLIQIEDKNQLSALRSAEASYENAKQNLKRFKIVSKEVPGSIAQTKLDEAETNLKAANAQLADAKENYNNTRIRAPFDGYMGTLLEQKMSQNSTSSIQTFTNLSVGSYVKIGTELVSITNNHLLYVQYDIPKKYHNFLKIGKIVLLNNPQHKHQKIKTSIIYVSKNINPDSNTYTVRALIPNLAHETNLFSPGANIMITQVLNDDRKMITVPGLSLVPSINGYSVYSINKGEVVSVPVTIGNRFNTEVAIESGVKVGDLVITNGVDQVNPGDKVKIKNQE